MLRFTISHEAERVVTKMHQVKYKGDLGKYLVDLENHNILAQVTGIAWQSMVEKLLQLEALRCLSNQEYRSDSEWLAAIRTVTKVEAAVKEQLGLWQEPTVRPDSSGKYKHEKE